MHVRVTRLWPCLRTSGTRHYCSMVIARWEAFTGERAQKVEG